MGMAVETGKPGKGPKPSINVTPLVDVVLVLLIIFMLIIPNMQDDKPIELINVMFPDKDADSKEEPLVVTIDRNEVYTLEEQDMAREQAIAALKGVYAKSPKRKVLLRGDAKVPYKAVRTFFKDVQDIGFGGVSLAVGSQRKWDGGGEVD
ncbi:biopolymer transporter ExbD [Nannocystis sp. ILAH1]|jgi:biopolymer transport protein TolR|uniref:ExbD/TolR family protein n=1 Tax=unclassified Nannocystis TaxID=2627009 RepID=UPI0022715D5A|nr:MULTISPECIES: biopolymer transporter ExbD [unclassified Nannocystis]MCY0988284.1 biopolymer transporter ExbD [Nannocystis sp. ILAH1]MCY1067755.1 biopolymer transporter ExbD [Nannocystis sp. RBIL2]